MVSRFENVTDYELNLSPTILRFSQIISWYTREIRENIHLRFAQNQIIALAWLVKACVSFILSLQN